MDVFLRAFRASPTQRRISEEHYELLQSEPTRPHIHIRHHHYPHPNHNNHNRRRLLFFLLNFHKSCSLRRFLIFLSALPLIALLAILSSGVPPSYNDIRSFERRLPQHNLSLPYPEGQNGTYLRFPGHLWGHGLNNILQETILMSYLAYMSNRSFVFEDYTWSHTPFPYTIYDFALRPKRIPLNAFISGPTAGGPMPSSTHLNSPRAISAEWWETVCPERKRHIVSSKDAPSDVEGDVLIDWWVRRLERVKEGCVEIDSSSRDVFDKFLFGSSRILSLWPSLSASPILNLFTWSPLVQSAVARNFALLNVQPLTLKKTLFDDDTSTATLTGLVAVHLRRGDYKRHCPRLATWGSEFMGLNQFSELPDKFDPYLYSPTSPSSSSTTSLEEKEELESPSSPPTRESHYLLHCLPTIPQIVNKLHILRDVHPTPLHRLYVLSNGWGWWLDELKQALKKDGWGDMVSSADIEKRLDAEQKWVGMAVDMAVAEKAEVFLGNGFSSLTSNVVMLRMAKGLNPSTNRFL